MLTSMISLHRVCKLCHLHSQLKPNARAVMLQLCVRCDAILARVRHTGNDHGDKITTTGEEPPSVALLFNGTAPLYFIRVR